MKQFLMKAMLPLAMALALQGCNKCGDGEQGKKEDCDDGNVDGGDGCSAECTIDENCTDGIDNDANGAIDCNDAACADTCVGLNGQPCAADPDCTGTNGACITESNGGFPAGYCISDCDPLNGNADCAGTGGVCVDNGDGTGVCADGCDPALNNTDCRDGYACTDLAGDGTAVVCFPACDSNTQCVENGPNGAPNSCDTDPNSQNAGFCVPTPVAEVCNNNVDDDLDGLLDCSDDDCAADAGCIALINAACTAAATANEGDNTGDTTGGSNLFASTCGGGGSEDIFTFNPATSGDFDFVLSSASDLGVYARSVCDINGTASELDCADSFIGGTDEVMTLTLTQGTAISVFVDAFTDQDNGPYTLTIVPVVCGDGILAGAEACDDGDVDPGDGCSDTCTVEVGFFCDTSADPSVCTDLAPICGAATDAIIGDNAGDTTGGTTFFTGQNCGFFGGPAGDGAEQIFTIIPGTAGQTGTLDVTLTTTTDHVLYVNSDCLNPATELGCSDNVVGGDETLSISVADAGNALTVFADAFSVGDEGTFTLTLAFTADVCGDGQQTGGEGCDDINGTPVSGDGCSDTCNVEDGFSCVEDANGLSTCTDLAPICAAAVVANAGDTTGDTTGGTSLFVPTNAGVVQNCNDIDIGTGAGPELIFSFTPAATGDVTLTLTSTADADLVIYVRSECANGATEIGCADTDFPGQAPDPDVETLTVPGEAGVPLTIFVDTFGTDAGAFTLNIQ